MTRKRIYIYADHTNDKLVESEIPLAQEEMEARGLSYIAHRFEKEEK